MKKLLKFSLSGIMVFSLLSSPIMVERAWADEIDSVCGQTLKDVQNKQSKEGDLKASYCVSAKLAERAHAWDTTIAVITGVGAGVCTGFAIWSWAGADGACVAIGLGVSGGVAILDGIGQYYVNELREKYHQSRESYNSAKLMSTLSSMTSMVPALTSSTSSGGCVMCAVSLGMQCAMATISAVGDNNTKDAMVKNAKDFKMMDNTVLQAPPVNLTQTNAQNPTVNNNDGSDTPSSDDCSTSSDANYVQCMQSHYGNAETAAITNDQYLGLLKKALGKDVGTIVRGYKGNSKDDLNKYIASQLSAAGFGGNIGKALAATDKLISDKNLLEKFQPMSYKKAAVASTKKDGLDSLDFSKMMSNMMGKLDPGSKEKKGDPSELVYRQLELLPADKIQSNKDISLFARVAFRYRKNITNLDQLNAVQDVKGTQK